MELSSGTALLHYRLVEKIGEGGMGVVWKAIDTDLDREVAIKVLPAAFTSDHERLARFQREARLLAALNHPNIATVHGLHEVEGIRFLAMELVAGEDLARHIARGALPVERATDIGRQVAEALEAAHDSGTIHRDLKPANIVVTPEGQVKVLDFGLAKSAAESGDPDISMSPTLTSAGTQAGMVLGTAAYLSPEQAKGQPVDRRTDIWAFGVVLHEMLTGERTFRGEGLSETLAAVILKEPDLEKLPAATPPRVRELVRRCLVKEARQRLRDIGEARLVLEDPLAEPAGDPAAATAAGPIPRTDKRGLLLALAALPVVAFLGFLLGKALDPAMPPAEPVRLSAEFSATAGFRDAPGMPIVLSPDGRRVAFVTQDPPLLHVRNLHHLEATALTGTERAMQPFFSPDGEWIGFFADGKLKKISIHGGAPVTLATANVPRGATWGPDETIVYTPGTEDGLYRVSASGGEPEMLTTPVADGDERERSHRWPHYLPDGGSVLFVAQPSGRNFSDGNLVLLELESGTRRVLHRGGSYPGFVRGGFVTFGREGSLFAARFDPATATLSRSPVPVIERVGFNRGNGGSAVSLSRTGTLVFLAADLRSQWTGNVGRLRPDGTFEPIAVDPGKSAGPRVSPDGRRFAYSVADAAESHNNIWVYDLERDVSTRLTFAEAWEWHPTWSPDGEWVIYSSSAAGAMQIYRKRADGSGEAEPLTGPEAASWGGASASPDGRYIAYHASRTDNDLMVADLEAGTPPTPYLAGVGNTVFPAFSPNGKWIAYESDESGADEVYVRAFPETSGRWQISHGGGEVPTWSPDGRTLYFESDERTISAVDVEIDGETFRAGRQREVVSAEDPFRGRWSVLRDGSFIVSLAETPEQADPDRAMATLVFDWPTELERIVPRP